MKDIKLVYWLKLVNV